MGLLLRGTWLSAPSFRVSGGGPVCAVGVGAVLWDFIGRMMSFTSNKDQLSAGDMSRLEDVSLDLCASFPIAWWPCSAFDLSKDIESGTIYAGQE